MIAEQFLVEARWTEKLIKVHGFCEYRTEISGFNDVFRLPALTRRRVKRGVFRSVAELQHAIQLFIDDTNQKPKPFVWTAKPRKILAAIK